MLANELHLATGRYLQEKAPVLIVGPTGVGKTMVAANLGHQAVLQGRGRDLHLLLRSDAQPECGTGHQRV